MVLVGDAMNRKGDRMVTFELENRSVSYQLFLQAINKLRFFGLIFLIS